MIGPPEVSANVKVLNATPSPSILERLFLGIQKEVSQLKRQNKKKREKKASKRREERRSTISQHHMKQLA